MEDNKRSISEQREPCRHAPFYLLPPCGYISWSSTAS